MKRFLIFSCLALALAACSEPDVQTTFEGIPSSLHMDKVTHLQKNFQPEEQIDSELASRFASLALTCVDKEFPNKISRTTNDEKSIGRPKDLFPVFYGCFDWHSAVHGHWMLVRLLHVGPQEGAWRAEAITKLDANITAENVSGELANFRRAERGSWERPYGWAWLLQLTAELREMSHTDPKAKQWLTLLQPLEADIVQATKEWLPKLAYPIHLGTHNQSAFALGLSHDWAITAGDTEFADLIAMKARTFHGTQTACPLAYEPSGEDFLSACLMTADLMRRILPKDEFEVWLSTFLPDIPKARGTKWDMSWLEPGIVLDASDGKLVHLDGVNLSRAWNLMNIARALPEDDPRVAPLTVSAGQHESAGVEAVSAEHYSGSHWLASFATYLMTDRGWSD